MPIAMKFVKAAGQNVKLQCECGRVFWYIAEKRANCPDCKSVWNGIYVTEFDKFYCLYSAARDIPDEFILIGLARGKTMSDVLLKTAKDLESLRISCNALAIREVNRKTYYERQEMIDRSNLDYLFATSIINFAIKDLFG